jgi:hypothetical protein
MCKPQRRSERASGKRNTKADPDQHGTQSHTFDDAFHTDDALLRNDAGRLSSSAELRSHSVTVTVKLHEAAMGH